MTVEVRHCTDPACSWSWGPEAKLLRPTWEFGAASLHVGVGGLTGQYGADYRDQEAAIDRGVDCFANLMAHWLDAAAETG
jgi:protein-disulfide isomerase-like protein with CxxC motif